MKKLDLEAIFDQLADIMKANFNTKLAEITTEKCDGLQMKTLNDKAIFIEDLDESTANFNPFVYIGAEDIQSEGHGPYTAEVPVISVILAVSVQNESQTGRKILRYQRALKRCSRKTGTRANGASSSRSQANFPSSSSS